MYTLFPEGRPVIGYCAQCGGEIYGENEEYLSDKYYRFDKDIVCEKCLTEYCDEHFAEGGE